jgi:nicotinamide riboside kinase
MTITAQHPSLGDARSLPDANIWPMRIAITGAHGVGKSTLATRISQILMLPGLPTPGRTMAEQGLPVNKAATVVSQTVAWLMQYRFEHEIDAWVASRSLIDVWAYASQAADRGDLDSVEQALMQELTSATRLAIKDAYDELIYVPPRITLVADDARSAEESFQRSTDAEIRAALADWGVRHVEVDVRDEEAVQAMIARWRNGL